MLFLPGAGGTLNVGIGLNNPTTRLAVGGLLQSQIAQDARYNVQLGYLAPSGMPSIGFSANLHADTTVNLVSNTRPARAVVITAADDALSFSRNANGAAQDAAAFNPTVAPHPMMVMKLDSGNVGIGTAAPERKLHAHENSGGSVYLKLSNTDTGAAATDGLFVGYDPAETAVISNAENTALRFDTNNTEKMRITAAGRVGIGTTAPVKTLDVIGGAAFQGNNLYIKNPLSPAGKKTWGFIVNTTGGTFNIGRATDAIPAGGSSVFTHIWLDPADDTTHVVGFVNESDARLKTDIAPLAGALEKVTSLQGVRFRWKNRPHEERYHTGLLAQDVEKIFPDLVYTGSDGMKSIASVEMIGVLTEAVKELKARNEIQQKEIDELKARLPR